MLKETLQSIVAATRNVLGNWRSMLLVALVYAALLAALYTFVVVREASMLQVVLTFVLALAAPLLFFLLQSMIVGGIAGEGQVPLSSLLETIAEQSVETDRRHTPANRSRCFDRLFANESTGAVGRDSSGRSG